MEGVECEFELWPIEHPSEPVDEDRPLKCPISNAHTRSLRNQKDNSKNLERGWKRAEILGKDEEEGIKAVGVGGVRKRHHELTQGQGEEVHQKHNNTIITPLLTMPPLFPYQHHDATIFDMLHHFNKIES